MCDAWPKSAEILGSQWRARIPATPKHPETPTATAMAQHTFQPLPYLLSLKQWKLQCPWCVNEHLKFFDNLGGPGLSIPKKNQVLICQKNLKQLRSLNEILLTSFNRRQIARAQRLTASGTRLRRGRSNARSVCHVLWTKNWWKGWTLKGCSDSSW